MILQNIMTTKESLQPRSNDETEVRALIERWARAVREANLEAIRADHDPEILMFDVPPPFLSQGLDAYMATWERFLAWAEKPVAFDFHDVTVTAGKDSPAVSACRRPPAAGEMVLRREGLHDAVDRTAGASGLVDDPV